MRADEPQDEFAIDWTPIWPEEDGRLEPILFDGPLWIEFAEAEPRAAAVELPQLVEFEEFALLDPEAGGDEPDEPPPAPRQRASPSGLAASLGVHLLALLVLIGWRNTPAEIGGAIPVQLVIEAAAGAPAEHQPGQSVAENLDQTPQADSGAVSTPAEPRAPPPKTHVASVSPPRDKPRAPRRPPHRAPPATAPPTPSTHAAKPVPQPPRTAAAALPTPAPAAPAPIAPPATAQAGSPSSASIAATQADSPSAASSAAARDGQVSGAATGQGDYLVYLEQLTRPYLYMLPPTFLAGRRGRTTLTVTVGDDGAISRIGVKHSSGYPDIDARIEQMVQAVGRFPPLPPQLRRPGADLDFNLAFPDVLRQ